tara:strand:- start:4062 stop:5696 length:1635 start_codon:yes stop_codon:yes gene_type:complete
MADVTVIEAISLLTKVSADTSSMLKKLSDRVDVISKGPGGRGKEELVKQADPVLVTDFGPKAEKDLAKLGGDAEKERQRTEKEKNKNNNLLKLLGLAGGAALALKFLFDGEGYTGLVQGFQNALGKVTKFASKAKGLIDDIGKRLGTFADDVGKKVGTLVDNITAKTSQWATKAKDGIKNAMDDVGKRLGNFGDELAKGTAKVISSAKNIASKVVEASTNAADDVARGASKVTTSQAAPKQGFLAKAGGFFQDTAQKTTQFVGQKATQVGSAVKAGVTAIGDTASNVGKFAKDKILKKFLDFMKVLKIKQVLGAIAKSPLLAPVIESVFTYKDVNNSISDYQEGKINKEELDAVVGNRTFKALGGLLGGAGGATLLASMMGGLSFGLAAPLGAIIGGILGDVGGRFVADKLADAMGDKVSNVGDFVLNTPLFNSKMGTEGSVENIDDGIITRNGKVIKPDTEDTIYAMKDGGPLGEALNKTPEMLGSLIDVEVDSLNLMKEQNALLREILNKTGVIPIPAGANSADNNKNYNQSGDMFRQLQMV